MRLQYLHKAGGHRLSAPSGAVYAFEPDGQGRRVAEFNPDDQEAMADAKWFLGLEGHTRAKLFAVIDETVSDEVVAEGGRGSRRKVIKKEGDQ
jgi:YD repeat-containing protein